MLKEAVTTVPKPLIPNFPELTANLNLMAWRRLLEFQAGEKHGYSFGTARGLELPADILNFGYMAIPKEPDSTSGYCMTWQNGADFLSRKSSLFTISPLTHHGRLKEPHLIQFQLLLDQHKRNVIGFGAAGGRQTIHTNRDLGRTDQNGRPIYLHSNYNQEVQYSPGRTRMPVTLAYEFVIKRGVKSQPKLITREFKDNEELDSVNPGFTEPINFPKTALMYLTQTTPEGSPLTSEYLAANPVIASI